MEKLPKLAFMIDGQKTCCEASAEKLSGESGKPIQFVVGEKNFSERAQAQMALVEETEKFVNAFTEPHVCEVSKTTTVAGKQFSCNVAAAQTAQLAKEAMEKVQMTYLVGDKECHCPVEAQQTAEQTGKPTEFVVGDQKTSCSVTARLNLARAKYKAAVEAIVKAEAPEQTPAQGS
jgi:hypothetical protein